MFEQFTEVIVMTTVLGKTLKTIEGTVKLKTHEEFHRERFILQLIP